MDWFVNLFMGEGIPHSIILLALSIALGIMLGKVKIFGVSLGGTCILFVGILFGELGMQVDPSILNFFKEFGLILFVFSIGLQVGPSFFSNFKKGGAMLNLLATLVVLLGVATTLVIYFVTDTPIQTMIGIMSGAITNTPGLGAAQQAFYDITGTNDPTIAMGYAVAYPLGVIGIILTIIIIRVLTGVNVKEEEKRIIKESEESESSTTAVAMEVVNPALHETTIAELGTTIGENHHFVVSRILKKSSGEVHEVDSHTVLEEGDKLFVIAEKSEMQTLELLIGSTEEIDKDIWMPEEASFISRKVIITKKGINGKRIKDLNLRKHYGVNITRVTRAGIDIVASPNFTLQYGDKLTIVGSAEALKDVSKLLGNSLRHLHEPNLITIFIGIALGILLGSLPIAIPGMPQPVKLGLAGGPLIVAILIARFGHRYKLVSYTTASANLMLREIGISLFLACVGLGAGGTFVDTLVNQGGATWVGYGVIITIVPILIVGLLGRLVFKIDYFTLCGLISGSSTNPPALAFSNSQTDLDVPSIGYATVYPLTMFLRVLAAQLLVIFFVGG
ncbi:MAG: putative transporter [Porphyromonas sp.]|nr:putative transporter [Porphyromonas sp.]